MYHYFVSYCAKYADGSTLFGHAEASRSTLIMQWSDVDEVIQKLKIHLACTDLALLNYQLLRYELLRDEKSSDLNNVLEL